MVVASPMKKFLLQWASFKGLPKPTIESLKDAEYFKFMVSIKGCDHVAEAVNLDKLDAEECACQAYLWYLIWQNRLLLCDLPPSPFIMPLDNALLAPSKFDELPEEFIIKMDSKNTETLNVYGWTANEASNRIKCYAKRVSDANNLILQQWACGRNFISTVIVYCGEIKTWVCGYGMAETAKIADSYRFLALASLLCRYGAIESRVEPATTETAEVMIPKAPAEEDMMKLPLLTNEMKHTGEYAKYDSNDAREQLKQYLIRTKQNESTPTTFTIVEHTGCGTAQRSMYCVEKDKWLLATSQAKDTTQGSTLCAIALSFGLMELGVLTLKPFDVKPTDILTINVPNPLDDQLKDVLCESSIVYPVKASNLPNNLVFDLVKGTVSSSDTISVSDEPPHDEYSLNTLDRHPVISKGDEVGVVSWSPPTADSKPWPEETIPESKLQRACLDTKLSCDAKVPFESPISNLRDDIVEVIAVNPVTLIAAKTVYGAASQIPQYIHDKCIEKSEQCNILVCNGYELTARLLALQVATQRGETLGTTVGYGLPNESITPKSESGIFFCNSDILLNKLGSIEGLEGISHVVVTDVHTNDLKTDLILSLLRDVVNESPEFRVVLTSALIENVKLVEYFGCAVINVESQEELPSLTHYFLEDILELLGAKSDDKDVKEEKVEDDDEKETEITNGSSNTNKEKGIADYKLTETGQIVPVDNLDLPEFLAQPNQYSENARNVMGSGRIGLNKLEALLKHLVEVKVQGAILVFLGKSPTNQWLTFLSRRIKNCEIVSLFKNSLNKMTDKIFLPPKADTTRIIFCGNLGESSIPLPHVSHVIDYLLHELIDEDFSDPYHCLLSKEKVNLHIDKAIAAGNVGSYFCFRSRAMFDSLPEKWPAQSLYTPLSDHLLLVHQLGSGNVRDVLARTMNPPPESFVVAAEQALEAQGIIDNTGELTTLGNRIVRLSLELLWGKFVLYGCLFGLGDHFIKIAVAAQLLKEQSINQDTSGSKNRLFHPNLGSNLLEYLKTVIMFEAAVKNSSTVQFCSKHQLVESSLHRITNGAAKMHKALINEGFPDSSLTSHSLDFDNASLPDFGIIRAMYLLVHYPRVYKLIVNSKKKFVCISNSNCKMFGGGTYANCHFITSGKMMRHLSSTYPLHILLFGSETAQSKGNVVTMDYNLSVIINTNTALRILAVRGLFFNIAEAFFNNPAALTKATDKKVLQLITHLCSIHSSTKKFSKPGPKGNFEKYPTNKSSGHFNKPTPQMQSPQSSNGKNMLPANNNRRKRQATTASDFAYKPKQQRLSQGQRYPANVSWPQQQQPTMSNFGGGMNMFNNQYSNSNRGNFNRGGYGSSNFRYGRKY